MKGPPTCALIDASRSPLAGVVEAKLLLDERGQWLERAAIDKVLAEHQLQAAFSTNDPSARVALGRILKADVLALVRTGEKQQAGQNQKQPYAELVVAETSGGLRLVSRTIPLGDDVDADAQTLVSLIHRAIDRHAQEIREVYAIPPFMSQDLLFQHDYLKASYARLLEQTVLEQPGVLVVELAEAESLAREFRLSDADGTVRRRLPLYLLGEYRNDGQGDARKTQVHLRLKRGEEQLNAVSGTMPPGEVPEFLRSAARKLVSGDQMAAVVAEPEAEARQLAQRAEDFMKLGDWAEALPLAEASLLLKPDQPKLHLRTAEAAMYLSRARASREVTAVRESLSLRRRAFEHLEDLLRFESRSSLFQDPALASFLFRHCPLPDRTGVSLPEQLEKQQQEEYQWEREVVMRWVHCAAEQRLWDQAASFLSATLAVLEPKQRYEEKAKIILQYQDLPGAEMHARLFAYRGYGIRVLDTVEGRQFLNRLAHSNEANAEVKTAATRMLAEAQAAASAQASHTRKPPASVTAGQQPSARFSFHPVEVPYVSPSGGRGELKYLSGCLALDDGTDVLWAERFGAVALKGNGPGRLLWTHPHMNAWIRSLNYDGRYLWLAVDTRVPELWVLDPNDGKTWQITAEHGLPVVGPEEMPKDALSSTIVAEAIRPGRAIVVGSIGRTWLASVDFDPQGKHQVRVFHEAKEKGDVRDPVARRNVYAAFQPTWTMKLSGASATGQVIQRVLIGRDGVGHPLIVDPTNLSVLAMDDNWSIPDAGSGGAEAGTVSGGAFYYTRSLTPDWNTKAVHRVGLPDLKSVPVLKNIPEGIVRYDGETVDVVGKQWWRGNLREGRMESLGAVPWIYRNQWGTPDRESATLQRGDLLLKALARSNNYGYLIGCSEHLQDDLIARVVFDGSGVPLEQLLPSARKAAALVQAKPRRRDPAAVPGNLWQNDSRWPCEALAYSPDGKHIVTVSGSAAHAVQVWNAADGKHLGDLLEHPAGMVAVAFSRSGKYFATGGNDGLVVLWDAESLNPLVRIGQHKEKIESLAFSWDDRRLAMCDFNRNSSIFNISSSTVESHFQEPDMGTEALAFTPEGDRLVISSQAGDVRYWHIETQRPLVMETFDYVVGFLPDKSLLGAPIADDTALIAWDCNTQSYRRLLENMLGQALAVSPDGRLLVTHARDEYVDEKFVRDIHRVRIWDLAAQRAIAVWDSDAFVRAAAFSSDSQTLVTVDVHDRLRHWRLGNVGQQYADERGKTKNGTAAVESLAPPVQITPERREWAEALAAFHSGPTDETFQTLERWLAQLRRNRGVTSEGIPPLELTYEVLSLAQPSTEEGWQAHFAKIARWEKLRPDSASPLVVKGRSYRVRAWQARGSSYASRVSQEGWQGFRENLTRAREALEAAAKLCDDDPQLYTELIEVAKGQSGSRSEADGCFRKATRIDPAYFPAYQEMCDYLLPRWHGEPGEVEKFILESARKIGGEKGLELFGRLVIRLGYYEPDAWERFPLDKVRQAARIMHQRYPDSKTHLNFACKIACIAEDRPAASALFEKIGGECDERIWGGRELFDAYRRSCEPD